MLWYQQNTPLATQALPAKVSVTDGLIGMPDYKNFILKRCEDTPFVELRSLEEPHLGFWSIDPFVCVQNYALAIADEDVRALEISEVSDILILTLAIVSQRKITLNTMAPLCIHRTRLIGKQIIPENYKSYSAKHVLYEEAVTCLS